MRCERICSLARYVMVDAGNPAVTTATQWFERTLDDSANKRLSVPEAFLAVDAILNIYLNVASGLVVHPKVIERHVLEELPFMASENIMMDAVKRGGNRQELHERIRVLSQEAGRNVKDLGLPNNLIDLIAEDPAFGMSREELTAHLAVSYTHLDVYKRQPWGFWAGLMNTASGQNRITPGQSNITGVRQRRGMPPA